MSFKKKEMSTRSKKFPDPPLNSLKVKFVGQNLLCSLNQEDAAKVIFRMEMKDQAREKEFVG